MWLVRFFTKNCNALLYLLARTMHAFEIIQIIIPFVSIIITITTSMVYLNKFHVFLQPKSSWLVVWLPATLNPYLIADQYHPSRSIKKQREHSFLFVGLSLSYRLRLFCWTLWRTFHTFNSWKTNDFIFECLFENWRLGDKS